MKKIGLIIALMVVLLCGCLPRPVSEELAQEKTEEYENKGEKWFVENEPDMDVKLLNIYWASYKLTNLVYGVFQDEDGEYNYYLNPDEGILYSDKKIEELKGYIGEYVAEAADVDPEVVTVGSISYGMPCVIFSDQSNTGKTSTYSEYSTSINVSGVDYYIDENGLRGIAVSALHDKVMSYLSVYISLESFDDIENKYGDLSLLENFESLDSVRFICPDEGDDTFYTLTTQNNMWELTKFYKKGDKTEYKVVSSKPAIRNK